MTALDRQALGAAYLWVTHRFPYLASAVVAMRVVPAPGLGPSGSAVDEAWRLYVDPAVAAGWTVPQLGALLVHHAGHLLRDHAGRAGAVGVVEARRGAWGLACDAELNDDLAEVGIEPPGDVVLPESFGARRGRPAEEYFALVPDAGDAPGDHGSGVDGLPRPWDEDGDDGAPGLTSHEATLVRGRVAEQLLEAARAGRGDVPGRWLRWAGELLDPTVDWRKALAAEVRRGVARAAGRVDYSYRRPSRRASASPDIVLPAMEQPVPEVAVVCDTSGSMGATQLAAVRAEVESLLRTIGVRTGGVQVLTVDAAVHGAVRARSVAQVRGLALEGGGGTDMAAGIAAAADLRPRPAVVVVLTDGLTRWPARAPAGVGVVVALVGDDRRRADRVPPWARVVLVDDPPAA